MTESTPIAEENATTQSATNPATESNSIAQEIATLSPEEIARLLPANVVSALLEARRLQEREKAINDVMALVEAIEGLLSREDAILAMQAMYLNIGTLARQMSTGVRGQDMRAWLTRRMDEVEAGTVSRPGRPTVKKAAKNKKAPVVKKPTTIRLPRQMYVNPTNPDLTWSGRGARPKWVKEYMEEKGGALEDLAAKA